MFRMSINHILILILLTFFSTAQAEGGFFSKNSLEEILTKCESEPKKCEDKEELFKFGFALVFVRGETELGWRLIERSADQEFVPSIYLNIERYYRNLDGKGLNEEKLIQYSRLALEIFKSKKAVELTAEDYLNIAFLYENGFGTSIDLEKAFSYMRESALLGDMSAKYNLSRMYKFGIGVEKSEEKSKEIFYELKKSGYFKN